jgi:hypothetical protein
MKKHEHHLRNLHHNQNGFIGICDDCQRIHLAFGVVMFSMEYVHFTTWQKNIAMEINKCERCICPHTKHFVFGTESEHLKLVLSGKELGQLNDLIIPGLLILEAERLINDRSPI